MRADYQRQLDFYTPNPAHKVLIVGAGSIGSYIAFGLIRMGIENVTVIDYDNVENHNLPNQFFQENEDETNTISKVIALKNTLNNFMPNTMAKVSFEYITEKIENCFERIQNKRYTAIFLAVDDMDVRKWVWNKLTENEIYTNIVIDPRVGGLYANIFSIPMNSLEARNVYARELWSNSEIEELPCTGKTIIDATFTVAGECIGRFRQYVKDNLKVTWTFHDYSIGTSVIMHHFGMKEEKRTRSYVKRTRPAPATTEPDNVEVTSNVPESEAL